MNFQPKHPPLASIYKSTILLTACVTVLGKPSRMYPDSPFSLPASSRFDNKLIMNSSGTNFPWLTSSFSYTNPETIDNYKYDNPFTANNKHLKTHVMADEKLRLRNSGGRDRELSTF